MRVKPYHPRLDRGHPRAAGLALAYPLDDLGARLRDLVTPGRAAALGGGSPHQPGPRGARLGLNGDGYADTGLGGWMAFFGYGPFSVAASAMTTDVAYDDGFGAAQAITLDTDAAGSNPSLSLMFIGGDLRVVLYGGPAPGYVLLLAGLTVENYRWYRVATTWDGSTLSLYVDGVPVNSAAAAFTPAAGSSASLGRCGAKDAFKLKGGIDAFLAWGRCLSPAEVAADAADPFAPLRGRPTSPALHAAALPPLAAGTAAFVHSGPGGIALSCGLPSGGTAPYATTWRRRVHPAGAWADLADGGGVSGAATADLADGSAAAGTLYDYLQRATDSASATADSGVVTAQVYTGGAIGGGGTGGPRIGSPFLRGA